MFETTKKYMQTIKKNINDTLYNKKKYTIFEQSCTIRHDQTHRRDHLIRAKSIDHQRANQVEQFLVQQRQRQTNHDH